MNMTDITIPPEAVEAAARAMCRQDGRIPDAVVGPDGMRGFLAWEAYTTSAHAAITIAIKAWPGMRDSQHMSFDGRVENVIILPLQESRDMSGYLDFKRTGVPCIDELLSTLERAGDAYHHTEMWIDDDDGPSLVMQIQEAAQNAATTIAAMRPAIRNEALEEAARVAMTPCPVSPHPRECEECGNSRLAYRWPGQIAAAIRALKTSDADASGS